MITTHHPLRTLLASVIVIFSLCHGALAQSTYTLPPYDTPYVNDFAQLVPDAAETALTDRLTEFRDRTGIEFTVVTIPSLATYQADAIEPFATALFNHWGVGNVTRNDGAMLMMSRDDRQLRIEVGSAYGRDLDASMKTVIESVMVPLLRQGEFALGISEGAEEIMYRLADYTPGANWEASVSTTPAEPGALRVFLDGMGILSWSLVGILLLLFGVGVARGVRNKDVLCPKDGTRMQLLPEALEDAHLTPQQQTEERLNSRLYDVYRCSACHHVEVKAKNKWFSGFGKCHSCGAKAQSSQSTTLIPATRTTIGQRQITVTCRHCNNHFTKLEMIPMIKTGSSSSSSSSFGGGSSSGGGASGSW